MRENLLILSTCYFIGTAPIINKNIKYGESCSSLFIRESKNTLDMETTRQGFNGFLKIGSNSLQRLHVRHLKYNSLLHVTKNILLENKEIFYQ
jgi:hypothetical protein